MMSQPNLKTMGTWPVFLTAISTILGAILFLRFGYAVAHVGLVSTLLIVFVGHLVTVPTALAVATAGILTLFHVVSRLFTPHFVFFSFSFFWQARSSWTNMWVSLKKLFDRYFIARR